MGAGPEDTTTFWALEKLSILLRHVPRNQWGRVIMRERGKHHVTIGATVVPRTAHVEIDLEVTTQLP